MRTLIISMTLLVVATTANAEWTRLGQTVEATILIDKATIKRSGKIAKIWVLSNYNSPELVDGKTYRSSKAHFEYDCADKRSRIITIFNYALTDGKGAVISLENIENPWTSIPPSSISLSAWKVVCEK